METGLVHDKHFLAQMVLWMSTVTLE